VRGTDVKGHQEKVEKILFPKRILWVGRRDHCLNTGRLKNHCARKRELPFVLMEMSVVCTRVSEAGSFNVFGLYGNITFQLWGSLVIAWNV